MDTSPEVIKDGHLFIDGEDYGIPSPDTNFNIDETLSIARTAYQAAVETNSKAIRTLVDTDHAIVKFFASFTKNNVDYPYSRNSQKLVRTYSKCLTQYDKYLDMVIFTDKEAKDLFTEATANGWKHYLSFTRTILDDFLQLYSAVKSGKHHIPTKITNGAFRTSEELTEHLASIVDSSDLLEMYTIQAARWDSGEREYLTYKERAKRVDNTLAIERGAIISANRALAFTGDTLRDAISLFRIKELPPSISVNDAFDENTGRLKPDILNDSDLTELNSLEFGFLACVAHEFYSQSEIAGELLSEITIPVSKFLKKMGKDYRGYSGKRQRNTEITKYEENALLKRDTLTAYAQPFRNRVGVTPNGSWYSVLTAQKYDAEAQTMTLSSPYIYELLKIIQRGDPKKPQYHQLLHSDVANMANQAAVEIADQIIVSVLERGNKFKTEWEKENKKIQWRTKYSTLLERCSMAKRELDTIWNSDKPHKNQAYNEKLRQIFSSAYNVLENHSDLPLAKKNLELPKTTKIQKRKNRKTGEYESVLKEVYITPTRSTLNNTLVITHEGALYK